jgi:hypothetical protein
MASTIDEKILDLCTSQGETQSLIRGLTDKVDKYIQADNARHDDLVGFRIEASKHLAEVATIVKDIKKDVDRTVDEAIPSLQREQASQKATLKNHSWLIRAIVGVTLLAVLGGAFGTLATCSKDAADSESVAISDVDVDNEAD